MAKKRFALKMRNGAQVRNIDDLKAHFDIESVVRDFESGRLLTWLEDRYYDEEADAIRQIPDGDKSLKYKLCKIFGIETPEEIERRKERLNRLKQYTNDKNILANVDKVAFDQEDLADLLDDGVDEIYLCANRFVIPLRMKNKNYNGVGAAVAVIRSKKFVDFDALGIKFENVAFDEEYRKLLPKVHLQKTIIQIHGDKAEATTKIINRQGIHARPAAMFVQKATLFESKIQLTSNNKTIDAKSVLMLMCLGIGYGEEVTITAEGFDSKEAVEALIALIDSGFGEN